MSAGIKAPQGSDVKTVQHPKSWLAMSMMLASSSLAWALTPTVHIADNLEVLKLESAVPHTFGDWVELPGTPASVVDAGSQQMIDRIYDQTLTRIYVNRDKYVIMLSIAYGRDQSDGFGLHQPEVCYPAQGFNILTSRVESIPAGEQNLPVKRINTALGNRIEPLTYWTVIGEKNYRGGLQKKMGQIAYGFSGKIADGMLVRISSVDLQTETAYATQSAFAQDLIAALPQHLKTRFTGILSTR